MLTIFKCQNRRVAFGAIVMTSFLLALSACTTQYTHKMASGVLETVRLKQSHSIRRTSPWVLHSAAALYLANPLQLYLGEHSPHPRAHNALLDGLERALRERFPGLSVGEAPMSLSGALSDARRMRREFMVYPQIVAMENGRNTWNELMEGKHIHTGTRAGTDKMKIQILLLDVRSGKLIDNSLVQGRAPMFAEEESQPHDLLSVMCRDYARRISGNSLSQR